MKKKPSSAKRSIQQQSFSPYVSSKRLDNVQSLLQSSNSKEDAILAILGIDSRYNEGCRELANYLLFGFYDLRLSQLEESGIPEEELDDVIILIRSTSVAVYCSSVLYNYLLPYIAHWRNLDLFCLSDDGLEEQKMSEEENEEFKIKSFVAMLHGSSHIGLPYWATRKLGVSDSQQPSTVFDKFMIEKWPLIQSYALEGVGGGGFFTMKYEVSNVHSRLLPIYGECDPADLEQILIKSLPLFERHWKEATNTICGSSNHADEQLKVADLDITERRVVEPLLSYYKHGRLSATFLHNKTVEDDSASSLWAPFVLFGTRTCEIGDASTDSSLRESGSEEQAVHMIIHSRAPRTPLSCTRTYFISSHSSTKRDFNILVELYSSCVEACNVAIKEYCCGFDPKKAELTGSSVLAKACARFSHAGGYQCKLEAFECTGKAASLANGKPSLHVKKVTASVYGIKRDTSSIGSVSFADSFVDSTISLVRNVGADVAKNGNVGSDLRNTSHLVLTAGIPRYMEWQTRESETGVSSQSLAKLGEVHLCSDSVFFDPEALCEVEFFKDASFLVHPHHSPPFLIPSSTVDCYGCYDTGLPNAVIMLQLDLKSSNFLPTYLTTGDTKLGLAFSPQSSSSKSFTSHVHPRLSALFSTSTSPKFETLGRIDPDLVVGYDLLQAKYMWRAGMSHRNLVDVRMTQLSRMTLSLQPHLTDFMKHFGVSFVTSDKPIPEKDVSELLELEHNINGAESPTEQSSSDAKVCITVVTGLPGCHGDRLCASLVSLHRERVRWVVVRVRSNAGNATEVDQVHLQKQLSQFVAKRRAMRPGAAATKRLRIIVEAVGFFDIAAVVCCITNHSEAATRERMFIGTVTVCIDPLVCYLEHNRLLPNVLEQCTPGVVSCVAFTGGLDDLKDKNLASMQAMVRNVNSNAAFLLAAGGHASRTSDYDLILDEVAFESPKSRSSRHLALPGMWNGSFNLGHSPLNLQDVKLEFSQPLLRGTLSARLRALRNAMGDHPYTGNIYMVKGLVAFTDSSDHEYDMCFVTRTADLVMEPRVQPQIKAPAPPPNKNSAISKPYHLHFYGFGLCEESLQNWLRKSGRQMPTKKCHKTKATLSRAERKRLQALHQNDPLPEGIFFNGAQYCSLLDNSRSQEHPCLDQFIEEFLKSENEEIDSYNAKIDSQSITDLFA